MLAKTVLQACVGLGVRDFCVCPGSRNSKLVHPLLQHREQLRVFPFFEERAAAFFALGRMQGLQRPVAVVTTSGTAVAELLPAVIEAHYQARPLVLVTADRPRRFRGTGAPQAIEQAALFEKYARVIDIERDHDVIELNPAWFHEPIHLNVCFEEPTAEVDPIDLVVPSAMEVAPPKTDVAPLEGFLQRKGNLLIIAGCLSFKPPLIDALLTLNAPVLADATSGLHAHRRLHRLLLRGGDRTAGEMPFTRVLRLGGLPSFRIWRDLETQRDVEVLSLTQRPFPGLARPSTPIFGDPTTVLASCARPQETAANWRDGEAANAACLEQLLESLPRSEPACIRRLAQAIPESATIFVGNSLPIRELSLVSARAMPWPVFANRGANGIDGNLSTFIGMASAVPSAESWGLFGDLTTLYDLASPAILGAIPNKRLRIVVINNGGGKIFRRLPNFHYLDDRDLAVVENHHRFDFQAWAQSWNLAYRLQDEDFDATSLPDGVVIELRPDPAQTEAFWKAWQPRSTGLAPS